MKPPIESISSTALDKTLWLEKARAVCKRIPPLWPLKHFVAVNPFLGFTDQTFVDSCALFKRVAEGGMLMPTKYFQEQWQTGNIQLHDLKQAIHQNQNSLPEIWREAASTLTSEKLILWIENCEDSVQASQVLTVVEAADQTGEKPWVSIVLEEIARFCAAYYDSGQSIWRMPWKDESLYTAWHSVTELDAGSELIGLRGFRNFVKGMPRDAESAIIWSLEKIGIAEDELDDFLHRQLISVRGWAGHVQHRVREKSMVGVNDDSLLELLAIRLAYDAALLPFVDNFGQVRELSRISQTGETPSQNLLAHIVWHSAFEQAMQRRLVNQLATQSTPGSIPQRPEVQAVFCIDVRSEMFRRSLEESDARMETLGFAGFFGLPIEYIRLGQSSGTAQCPVLLLPQYKVREKLQHADADEEKRMLESRRVGKRISHSWNSFKTSAISCFSFVEVTGLTYGAKIFQDAFVQSPAKAENSSHSVGPNLSTASDPTTGIPLPDRIQLALGILRSMSLTQNFARIVLLCGHGSTTANNPFGSGLDCGACGGHTGEANARVGAAILNDPDVRGAVADQGIQIPADTWFLAGLHNTTTDDVLLYDVAQVPETHNSDIVKLTSTLAKASQSNRKKRAPLLGLKATASEKLAISVRQRSLDWAQVRPEWGLAGNAAFVVAPRSRTRNLDLGGRSFLHNYDYRNDTENKTLELIMSAPMVVTNWINLQYYGSTVNNAVFGSGNKVLHNVVGTFGVCLGNGGDLQTGLPLQSVHDGEKWIHEPHRLNVFIEAPREQIERVITKVEIVRQLVDNQWLHLFAIEETTTKFYRYLPGLRWEEVVPETASTAGIPTS